MVVVDLDHFKMVNDAFGHAAGDAVLREVGTRLRSIADSTIADSVPAGRCHVVRMGGDEFLIALHSSGEVPIDELANHLDDARRQPLVVVVEGRHETLVPEFSFGIADTSGPGDLDEVMAAADLASYADKTRRSMSHPTPDHGPDLPAAPDHAGHS
jgi:diguanylate cyclase (GGDEF)-like protein